jgi:hypothetical protein
MGREGLRRWRGRRAARLCCTGEDCRKGPLPLTPAAKDLRLLAKFRAERFRGISSRTLFAWPKPPRRFHGLNG